MQIFRKFAMGGLVAASLMGLSAPLETAQAMPLAMPMAHGTDGNLLTTVRYYYYRHRRYYRPYRYDHRRAGLYRCGRYALHTHLSRRAC